MTGPKIIEINGSSLNPIPTTGSFANEIGAFDLSFHMDMFLDTSRYVPIVGGMLKTLHEKGVQQGTIFEAGSGLLNLAAGAALDEIVDTVVAIEHNGQLFNYVVENILPHLPSKIKKKLVLIKGDALKVTDQMLAELGINSLDGIFCELMDTGGISEFQLPVLKHLSGLEKVTEQTVFSPCGWQHYISLIEHPMHTALVVGEARVQPYTVHYAREGLTTDPNHAEGWKLTDTIKYENVKFGSALNGNGQLQKYILPFLVSKDGKIDYVLLETKVDLPDGTSMGICRTLNNPLFLPFSEKIEVKLNVGLPYVSHPVKAGEQVELLIQIKQGDPSFKYVTTSLQHVDLMEEER